MRLACLLLVLALGLAFGSLTAPAQAVAGQERPVSGVVNSVDELDLTLYVGPVQFYVPANVYDLEMLEEGDYAIVHFVRTRDGLVATELRVNSTPQ